MTSNILPFTKKTLTACPANLNRKRPRSDDFTVENVRKIAATYAPVPAWVAARSVLNRAVTILRERGWRVDCHPDHRILCFHPNVENTAGVNIIEAMEIEVIFSHQNSRGGAA